MGIRTHVTLIFLGFLIYAFFRCFHLSVEKFRIGEEHGAVRKGRLTAKNQAFAVVGLAKDCLQALEKQIERIEYLGSQFREYKVVVMENDSKDGTRARLEEWASVNTNVILVECEDLGTKRCHLESTGKGRELLKDTRIARLANFRARCQKTLFETGFQPDYVAVVDMDILGELDYNGFFHTLSMEDWDAISVMEFTNLNDTFYWQRDTLAFVGEKEDWPRYDGESHIPVTYHLAKFLKLGFLAIHNELIPVKSAGGGFILYRGDVYKAGRYKEDYCEHVAFQKSLLSKGYHRFFINPKMVSTTEFQPEWIRLHSVLKRHKLL
jgi:hypothetical protein